MKPRRHHRHHQHGGQHGQRGPDQGNYYPQQGGPDPNAGGGTDEMEEADLAAANAPQLGPDGQPLPPPKILNLTELRRKSATELLAMAQEQGLENISRAKKQDIVFQMLKAAARRGDHIYGEGTLEILQDGYGFLRSPDSSYVAGPDDVYISPSQIRR